MNKALLVCTASLALGLMSGGALAETNSVGVISQPKNGHGKNVQISGKNLPEVLQSARAVPHYSNGKFDGYKLLEVKKGGVFEKRGMKAGDIINLNDDGTISKPQG